MPHDLQLSAEKSLLLVVDIQQGFVGHIPELDRVIEKSIIMIEAARLLELPIMVTQQYPKGLGQTVPQLQELLTDCPCYDKVAFSCCGDDTIRRAIRDTGRTQIILVGIETHVCVAQTCFDLLDMNLLPYVIADAVDSRRPTDRDIALQRLNNTGVIVTTAEAAILEMTVSSKYPAFKAISKLIK